MAEGQILTDVNRFDVIRSSDADLTGISAADRPAYIDRLVGEYKAQLQQSMRQLKDLYTTKFKQKITSETKLRGKGGAREEAALYANITGTFGGDSIRDLIAPAAALPQDETQLAQAAETTSLVVLSTLEFQNTEGRQLIFERNVDERILALISELSSEDRGERRERLFVWEASPELKKAEAFK